MTPKLEATRGYGAEVRVNALTFTGTQPNGDFTTVTNTVGDLYSRINETDKATACFKNVGDAYASQGFTVKAIAMYKKICKLQPSLESLLRLAELYSQQGLFNDARAQYLQVAEEFLKAGELENAVRIFQNPDRSFARALQAKLGWQGSERRSL